MIRIQWASQVEISVGHKAPIFKNRSPWNVAPILCLCLRLCLSRIGTLGDKAPNWKIWCGGLGASLRPHEGPKTAETDSPRKKLLRSSVKTQIGAIFGRFMAMIESAQTTLAAARHDTSSASKSMRSEPNRRPQRPNLPNSAQICTKSPKICTNLPKHRTNLHKIAQICPKSPKPPKSAQNRPNLHKFAQNRPNMPKTSPDLRIHRLNLPIHGPYVPRTCPSVAQLCPALPATSKKPTFPTSHEQSIDMALSCQGLPTSPKAMKKTYCPACRVHKHKAAFRCQKP